MLLYCIYIDTTLLYCTYIEYLITFCWHSLPVHIVVGRVDDGVSVVRVVGGRGCRKAWGVGIEQGRGHGYGAQAGVRGMGVWAGARACSGQKAWV